MAFNITFPEPEFFDIFGIFVFTFILLSSIWALKTKKPLPKSILIILILIAVLGLMVDGAIIYQTYLK